MVSESEGPFVEVLQLFRFKDKAKVKGLLQKAIDEAPALQPGPPPEPAPPASSTSKDLQRKAREMLLSKSKAKDDAPPEPAPPPPEVPPPEPAPHSEPPPPPAADDGTGNLEVDLQALQVFFNTHDASLLFGHSMPADHELEEFLTQMTADEIQEMLVEDFGEGIEANPPRQTSTSRRVSKLGGLFQQQDGPAPPNAPPPELPAPAPAEPPPPSGPPP